MPPHQVQGCFPCRCSYFIDLFRSALALLMTLHYKRMHEPHSLQAHVVLLTHEGCIMSCRTLSGVMVPLSTGRGGPGVSNSGMTRMPRSLA